MKFIISAATVSALNLEAKALLTPLINEIEPGADLDKAFADTDFTDNSLANSSINLVDGEWVLEVNDEGIFKYMAIYMKVAKFITPFVKPFLALTHSLSDDINEIQRWIGQRK
jgi:hypothetical protein